MTLVLICCNAIILSLADEIPEGFIVLSIAKDCLDLSHHDPHDGTFSNHVILRCYGYAIKLTCGQLLSNVCSAGDKRGC